MKLISVRRAVVIAIGVLLIASAVWIAALMPGQICRYHGDAGECSDSTGLKLMVVLLGVVVGGLLLVWGSRRQQ